MDLINKLLGFSVVRGLLIQLNHIYDDEISKINNSEQKNNTPNFYEHEDIIPTFLTTLKPYFGIVNRVTSFDKNKSLILENKVFPSKPSNRADIIFFKNALNKNHTIIHEVGHALYLEHIFDTEEAKPGVLRTFSWFNVDFPITNALIQPKHYTFYQGYTDNAMDYTYKFKNMKDENNKLNFEEVSSKFEKQMNSFYKWQWDIMRAYPFLINE